MSFLLFPLLTAVNKKYRKGDYQRILRGFPILYSNEDKYSCYVNVHRVGALIFTNNKKWESEYQYVLKNHQLDTLGEDDKNYIALYIFLISDGAMEKIEHIKKMELSKVSKRTRKYFPWAIEDMKVALRKHPNKGQGVDSVEFV